MNTPNRSKSTRTQAAAPGRSAEMSDASLAQVLALKIADGSVRSEVELFAHAVQIEGSTYYDLSDTSAYHNPDLNKPRALTALMYIDFRGNVFPWQLVRHPDNALLVTFREVR